MDDWKKYITDPIARSDSELLAETTELLFNAMSSGGQDAIDFSSIEESTLSIQHSVVALRATFSRKDTMNGWYSLLGKVRRRIVSSGLSLDIIEDLV